MKSKKLVAALLSASILSLSTVTAFASNSEPPKPVNSTIQLEQIVPIKAEVDKLGQVYYASFTGTVKDIKEYSGVEGAKLVYVVNADGMEANLLLSKDTFVLNKEELKTGAVITGYYDANAPMIMIYPAQYNTEVIVVENNDQNVKVSVFNKDFISEDNDLKLTISDGTEIILQDGTPFAGDLANRKLIVLYGITTKSIPAQTTPSKVIVLFEKIQPVQPLDVSKSEFVVNDKKVQAPTAYTNAQGTVMVPLRALSEALGYEVSWDNQLKSVSLNKSVALTLGQDFYTYMKMAPIKLGAAPEASMGRIFVPLNFFKEVLRMNNAYVFENQIVIDNKEEMK